MLVKRDERAVVMRWVSRRGRDAELRVGLSERVDLDLLERVCEELVERSRRGG
jgi:hypothetical protein